MEYDADPKEADTSEPHEPREPDEPPGWSDPSDPAPFAEARGPHLPDVIGRLPWLAWLFIVFAVGDIAWHVANLRFGDDASISERVIGVLQAVPSAAAVLLPAALLARHPDARRRIPTLLFGTILYAVVQGMSILTEPLGGFFESLTPPSEDLPFLVPLAAIYNGLVSLVAAFGLAYIAVGLSQARHLVDRPRSVTTLFVPVAAIFGTAVGVLSVSRLDLGETAISPTLVVYVVATVILGVVRIVAWTAVATAAARGWEAGENPTSGWRLAMLGAGLVIVALVLVNVVGLFDTQDQAFVTAYGYAIVLPYALGHLCLLAAFALGLPSLDEPDDEDDDGRYVGDAFEDDDLAG